MLDAFEKEDTGVANPKKNSKRHSPAVKPKSDHEVRTGLLPNIQSEHQERVSSKSDYSANDVEANGREMPRLRDTVETVKKRFAENDRRRAADLKKQWEDDLRNQILSIWKKDHSQTIPQIVKRLRFPSGYSKKNQNFSQLVHVTISAAAIRYEQDPVGFEKELQRLEREERTGQELETQKQLGKAELKRQKGSLQKQLRDVILSIYKENPNLAIDQIVNTLKAQELPKGSPKKSMMLAALVRNTLANFLNGPVGGLRDRRLRGTVKQTNRTLSDTQHTSRAGRYAEIKSKVAASYQRLKEQLQPQIYFQSVGLTPIELAFAAVAPASSDQERNEALSLVKASGSDAAVSSVLLENFSKNDPTSRRRINIIDALRELGKSEEIAKLLNEHGVIENPNSLQWSVLPPGWWNDSKYTDQITKNSKTGQLLIERLRYVDQLNPLERWRSQERLGSDPYWVFVFPHHVVAECPTHGNAIYIIKGTSGWQNLLNRSKADLLKAFPDRVVRIMHRGDWESRLSRVLREK